MRDEHPTGPPIWAVLLLIALGVVVFSVLAEWMRPQIYGPQGSEQRTRYFRMCRIGNGARETAVRNQM